MKKIVVGFILVILIISGFENVFAYRLEDYSIDIPVTYTKTSEKNLNNVSEVTFKNNKGTRISINRKVYNIEVSNVFRRYKLKKFEKYLISNQDVSNVKDQTKNEAKQKNNGIYSQELIDQYIDSMKVESVDKKEIIKTTKNKYKCFHFVVTFSTENIDSSIGQVKSYGEIYIFVSNNTAYTLSIVTSDESELESSELKDIINSFTIDNYKEPKRRLTGAEIKFILAIVFFIIALVYTKLKPNKGNQNNQ